MVYEVLKHLREYLQSVQRKSDLEGYWDTMLSGLHWVQAVAHVLQYAISYALMLVALTYQVYLYVAVVAGAGVAYLILQPLMTLVHAHYGSFGDPCC